MELAETLAELISWFGFSFHARRDPGIARKLLRCQFLTNSPGPGYEYQLYWFWLFFSGLAEHSEQVTGTELIDTLSPRLSKRIEAFACWARSGHVTACLGSCGLMRSIAEAYDASDAKFERRLCMIQSFAADHSKDDSKLKQPLDDLWNNYFNHVSYFIEAGLDLGGILEL
jgi:hypothetical protein